MKYVIGAIALVMAVPAVAQTAPAAHHQGHATEQHRHGQTGHGEHPPRQPEAQGMSCCADRNNNGRMDCCENMPAGQSCGAGHREQAPQGR